MGKVYTIGESAAELGTPASTIRLYDKNGLFPDVARSQGGIRVHRGRPGVGALHRAPESREGETDFHEGVDGPQPVPTVVAYGTHDRVQPSSRPRACSLRLTQRRRRNICSHASALSTLNEESPSRALSPRYSHRARRSTSLARTLSRKATLKIR